MHCACGRIEHAEPMPTAPQQRAAQTVATNKKCRQQARGQNHDRCVGREWLRGTYPSRCSNSLPFTERRFSSEGAFNKSSADKPTPCCGVQASRRHFGVEFRIGDAEAIPAEAIPLGDASVDAVTCSFGMLHMERPERVLAEVARVLRSGVGRFAMTAWTSDGDFFELVGQAVQAHADMCVSLPPAPPIFRFGDEGECRSALLSAGLAEAILRPRENPKID